MLVEPTDHATMFDIGGIQFEVCEPLGIRIDVLTPRALPAGFRVQELAEVRWL